jgi:hypothetical protein
MSRKRETRLDEARFTPEEVHFFRRMNPRIHQPVDLADDPSDDRPRRGVHPTYLVALVGFAGILFFLSGAI